MRKMQEIQPEVKAIQDRYSKLKATDPAKQKMNQELMALYKERGVNPASGCVPMLLADARCCLAIAARCSPRRSSCAARRFFGWIHDLSAHDPFYVTPILHGREPDVAAEADAVGERRSRSAENADVHARDVHVHVPVGAGGTGHLLRHDEPAEHRAAVISRTIGWDPPARAPASGLRRNAA